MESYDIMTYFAKFYLWLLILLIYLYLRTMYTQYKNAHDKWYDINKKLDNEELFINQLD